MLGQARRAARPPEAAAWLATAGVALGAVLVVAWVLVRPPVTSAPDPGPVGPPTTTDVAVERVRTHLADGRLAMGSFTLRLRDGDGALARGLAGAGPTPRPTRAAPVEAPPGVVPPRKSAADQPPERVPPLLATLQQQAGSAMAALSYEETAGEAGRARLREAVREAANAALPDAPVTEVFVREYLVQ